MMSIDEAIAHEKELSKEVYVEAMLCHANPNDEKLDGCIKRGKYHEQIAEWLEELKELRKEKDKFDRNLKFFNEINSKCFNKGYSKAENDYHAQSEKDRHSSYDCGYEVGYAKAIDDFVEKAKYLYIHTHGSLDNVDIEYIAEELKAGEAE